MGKNGGSKKKAAANARAREYRDKLLENDVEAGWQRTMRESENENLAGRSYLTGPSSGWAPGIPLTGIWNISNELKKLVCACRGVSLAPKPKIPQRDLRERSASPASPFQVRFCWVSPA